MKEQIYTIPINSSFEQPGGCPVCRLASMLESESLEYSLGPAMMEPDVRQAMNSQGICAGHYRDLLGMQKRLPLALTLESRLKYLQGLSDLSGAASGCYVCGRVSAFMDKMYSNIVYLWLTQPEFRQRLDRAERICLPHICGLLRIAKRDCGRKEYPVIAAALNAKGKESLEQLGQGVSSFCKSFDHRYAGIELGEDRRAVERTIDYLNGGSK